MNQEFETNDLSNTLPSFETNEDPSLSKGVAFEEGGWSSSRKKHYGKITQLVIDTGLAKDEKGAQVILMILIAILFFVAIMILPKGTHFVPPPHYIQKSI